MRIFTVSRQHSWFFYLLVAVSLLLGLVGPTQVVAAPDAPGPDLAPQATVTVEGNPTVNTAYATGGIGSISLNHTTGTGTDRLLLVGVSWNANTCTTCTISSITFTPSGGSALPLAEVISRKYASNYRYAAIWYLPTEPPSGTTGTVLVTFGANVSGGGIVAGAVNFAGVDTITPLGSPNGADASSNAVSVTLTGLAGDELVFDNLFVGGTTTSATAGADQTQLTGWNSFNTNARGAASTEQAAGSSVVMDWSLGGSYIWVDVAVPIFPACTGPRYTLTAGNDGNGAVTLTPAGGSYCSGRTVTLRPVPNSGYLFSGWVGANAGEVVNTGGVYTIVMNGNKSVTANFAPQSCQDVSLNAAEDTYLSAAATSFNYGATQSLQADWTTGTSRRTALLKWDVSGISTTAVVNSASIVLQVTDLSNVDFQLYEVAAAWVEGDLNGTASSLGSPGANWTYRDYQGGIAWGAVGASSTTGTMDRGVTDLWTATNTSFSTGTLPVSKSVALNADGVAVVQRWVAGGANNGVIIQNYTTGTSNVLIFNSSEGATPPAMTINRCLPNNTAPQPTLVSPGNGATGVSTSPTLDVTVSDTDGNATDVTFWGRQAGSGTWQNLGTVYGVANSTHATWTSWPGRAHLTQYEWYVTVGDGVATITGSTWSFTTAAPEPTMDYGDAPDANYQTLLASNGARHMVIPGINLGPLVDVEPDGQPSLLADGDDLNPLAGPDDEDGVIFVQPILIPGNPAAPILVDGGPSGGKLDAWIDFNGNGAFDHPIEHLWGGASQVLVPGPQPLTFAVPANAVLGPTYARFRLSTGGNLPPFGLAPDGEVEDYRVLIEAEPGTIIVEKQTTPDGNPRAFTFTGDAAGSIADGGQIVVSGLAPGAYQSVETVPAGWTLTQIVCDDTNSTGDVLDFTANFQLEAGETVKCTFYNLLPLDYGDAPDVNYQTLLASNGARHQIILGHSLGPLVDAELDGQPSVLADGDDLKPVAAPDDEDGVTLPTVLTAGDPAAVVLVDGGPSGGKLDAWIDFDGNGAFDPTEHLWGGTSQTLPVSAGPQPLTFALPAGATPGTTYARFRLSIAGGLLPVGLAPDGEVEDYRVQVVDATPPETTLDSAPPDPSASADATFTFSSSEVGSTFECKLDAEAFAACTSPKAYTGLSDGSHTFQVRATDAASNTDPTPVSYTWTVDTVAPETMITANPPDPSASASASFSFSSSEAGSTFECQLDSGGFSACTNPKAYTGLSDGSHTFQVRATDAASNVDATPATYAWTIDRTAPVLTIAGFTADGTPMAVGGGGGYILPTTNVGTINHEIRFAAGSTSSEPLAGLTGLYLNPAGVDVAGLTAYYMARIPDGSPAEALAYRAYLIAALDGVTHPFAYITTDGSNNLVLHDAAQYDLAGNLTVGMIVPDDYPLGTYPVQGTARDAAGNGAAVSLSLIVTGDRTAPTLDITGATADGTAMAGDPENGYTLPTTNDPADDWLIQFADGTSASEALANEYFGLYLTDSTVSADFLKAYYTWKGVPEPYLTYLKDAADSTNPFVYIRGSTVTLVDAAKRDLQAVDDPMTVPDTFPSGTYTVRGVIRDLAGNETTVTLILKVAGPAPSAPNAPAVSIVKLGSDVQLSWPAVQTDTNDNFIVVTTYQVFRSSVPYFTPDPTPGTGNLEYEGPNLTYLHDEAAGSVGMYFYIVRAVNNVGPSANSRRVGVFTFQLVPGQ